MKMVKLSDAVHKRLFVLRASKGFASISDVIESLLEDKEKV